MKLITSTFLIVSATILCVSALPASFNPDDDAEVVVVPLEKQSPSEKGDSDPNFDDFDGVVEGEIPGGFFTIFRPFSFDISSIFSNFEDTLRRMREHLWNSRPPFSGDGVDVDEVDPSKGNTTSTVQIIDGHKVTTNETIYVKKTDFGTSIFKHRTVDVQPLDEEGSDSTTINPKAESTTKRDTELAKDPESAEFDATENEVVKGIVDESNVLHDIVNPQIPLRAHVEDFGSPEGAYQFAPSSQSAHLFSSHKSHELSSWMDDVNFQDNSSPYFSKFSKNDIEKEIGESALIDLSDDIAVNEMLADQGVAASDDVEVFTVDNIDTKNHQNKYHYSDVNPIK
ncbi:icarapin-like [Phlebotomus argentipes]|uniref:icarapin-like n=1 Tax=Phlebotomus argentipes TaxID=94469 RepID=UPI002892E00B|nr:icarapin-like [Phlebotomus argentipes]